MEEQAIAEVINYYDDLGVAVIRLSSNLNLGEVLHFRGGQTDFEEKLTSMELKNEPVENAIMGDEVGIKLSQPAKAGDIVFRVLEETSS